jgi:tetratricopeptide (TPR) repeat protein
LRLQPDLPDALYDLGDILYRLGRSAEAQRSYRAALCLRPEHPELHMSLGVTLLLAGQFEEGWKELEWRLQTKGMVGELSRFSVPSWNGEAIGDRVILLHAEYGLGDTLQFCRYVGRDAIQGAPSQRGQPMLHRRPREKGPVDAMDQHPPDRGLVFPSWQDPGASQ